MFRLDNLKHKNGVRVSLYQKGFVFRNLFGVISYKKNLQTIRKTQADEIFRMWC